MRLLISLGWILVLAAVTGCGPSTASVTEPSVADFGRFEGEVVAVWDADGRNMTLREDFAYVDAQGRRWLAPAGTVVNGASIPRLFWTVIGSPFSGKYRNASVVHDIECEEMRQPWEAVHRMFYEACRCGGVDEAQAKIMYYAVHHFGPRWQLVVENVIEQVADAQGQMVEQEVTVQHVVRIDPPPPTPDELEQVKAFIEEDNPEPVALERFTRDALHRRPGRGRRDDMPGPGAEGTPITTPRVSAHWQNRPEGLQPGARPVPDRNGNPPNRRPLGQGTETRTPPISEETQQWVAEIVRQHFEQQAGGPRPAQFSVERSRGGYRVLIQFLHQDDQGQMVPYEGGTSTARVSREGEVIEVVSGFVSPDLADLGRSLRGPPKEFPARRTVAEE
jgi:hypothetical protein